jgi:hypothetical protein
MCDGVDFRLEGSYAQVFVALQKSVESDVLIKLKGKRGERQIVC